MDMVGRQRSTGLVRQLVRPVSGPEDRRKSQAGVLPQDSGKMGCGSAVILLYYTRAITWQTTLHNLLHAAEPYYRSVTVSLLYLYPLRSSSVTAVPTGTYCPALAEHWLEPRGCHCTVFYHTQSLLCVLVKSGNTAAAVERLFRTKWVIGTRDLAGRGSVPDGLVSRCFRYSVKTGSNNLNDKYDTMDLSQYSLCCLYQHITITIKRVSIDSHMSI